MLSMLPFSHVSTEQQLRLNNKIQQVYSGHNYKSLNDLKHTLLKPTTKLTVVRDVMTIAIPIVFIGFTLSSSLLTTQYDTTLDSLLTGITAVSKAPLSATIFGLSLAILQFKLLDWGSKVRCAGKQRAIFDNIVNFSKELSADKSVDISVSSHNAYIGRRIKEILREHFPGGLTARSIFNEHALNEMNKITVIMLANNANVLGIIKEELVSVNANISKCFYERLIDIVVKSALTPITELKGNS